MNTFFTHFISRGDPEDAKKRLAYAAWFVEAIPDVEFDGDERLFYEYLDYSVELSVPISENYFQVWLNTELSEVLHRTKVRVPGCETVRLEDPVGFATGLSITSQVLFDDFRQLSTQDSNTEDFKVEAASYFKERCNDRLTQTLSSTFEVLNSTDSATEASDFALEQISAIKDIYDPDKLEDLVAAEDHLDGPRMEKVTDYGLPAIDNDSHGIYTTQLVGIEAQSGTGKTRFCLGVPLYRAATIHKKNCLFIALEQSKEEVEDMLVACHVFWMFNIQISDKMLQTHTVPDEIKPQVEAARYDLFKSGKYGKIVIEELTLYVESFITKIKTLDKLKGPFDLICIDYMGIIESQPKEFRRALDMPEIVASAFKQFKRYVRRYRKAGIAISQFNKEGINAGKQDKEITTDMAQGGIAVYRNTDYNIAISMTESMKMQQKRRFSQPKVRSSSGFHSFIADTRLGFCYFKQVVTKEV